MNVFDYLDWRGDLTLDLVPLCDVDAAVLSRLSYLPPDGLASCRSGRGHGSCGSSSLSPPLLLPEDGRFIPRPCGASDGEMRIMDCVNQMTSRARRSFRPLLSPPATGGILSPSAGRMARSSAGRKISIRFHLPCSGPAARGALCRLGHVALSGEFLLGGHSKGGNLAVYAAAFCPAALQERIAAGV